MFIFNVRATSLHFCGDRSNISYIYTKCYFWTYLIIFIFGFIICLYLRLLIISYGSEINTDALCENFNDYNHDFFDKVKTFCKVTSILLGICLLFTIIELYNGRKSIDWEEITPFCYNCCNKKEIDKINEDNKDNKLTPDLNLNSL